MRNSFTKMAALLLALGATSSVRAFEWRAPLISQQGPMRYLFAKEGEKTEDKYSFNMWSAGHCREAYKAFLKHGTNTEPLSAVIFNKADFRLSEIFPNSRMPINTEFYNPFMRVVEFSPRISYQEKGFTMGGRLEFPVWEDKGRLGVRASVPFRNIKIENDTTGGGRDDAQAQNQRLVGPHRVEYRASITPGSPGSGTATVGDSDDVRFYRYDLVEALPRNLALQSMIQYAANGQVSTANNSVFEQINTLNTNDPTDDGFVEPWDAKMVLLASPKGIVPRCRAGFVIEHTASENNASNPAKPLPADLNVDVTDDTSYFAFDARNAGVDYNGLADDANASTGDGIIDNICDRLTAQERKANLWFVSVHKGDGKLESDAQSAVSLIENALKRFDENPEEWMADRGMVFDSHQLMGLGDIDLDLFYEHTFNKDMVGELMVGVRFPTGIGSNYSQNPFKVHLGNGEHWEVKLGALGAWQACSWLNVKADAHWSFVLESTENRTAGFCGQQIKNIGPCQKADVDWGYLVANIDFNFHTLKDCNFSSMLGYQFYFKTEDDVSFKCSGAGTAGNKAAAWFGRTKTVTTSAVTFTDLLFDLHPGSLEKNTEQFAHRLRWEGSYRFSECFEMFCGGMWTFAGKNIAREMDFHAGMNLTFN